MKVLYTVILLFSFSLVKSQTFVKNFNAISQLASVDNQAFFVANDGIHGLELWKTDGSQENTHLIKDINTITSSSPDHLTMFNDEVYFSANDGIFGVELWKSDGTEQGTFMLKNIYDIYGASSIPSNFLVFNNELYFTASNIYTGGSHQLWKTDGTTEGTIMVYNAGTQSISQLVSANNRLYFRLNYGPNRLMRYAVNSGVSQVTTVANYTIDNLNSFNDDLYFTTNSSNNQNIRVYKIGDNAVNVLLQEFTQPIYGDIDIYNFIQVDTEVYFSLTTDFDSASDKDELWKTDGTNSGTVVVKSFDWNSYESQSNISNFIEYQNQLYFKSGSQNNHTLWKSDGTDNGTVQALNVSVDRSVNFSILNDQLFFASSQKLWSTDGTQENTRKFSDLSIANLPSDDFFNVKLVNDKIFFEAEYQNNNALFTTESNPFMEVKRGNAVLEINSDFLFESKIDSIVKHTLSIKNVGNQDLVFSNIKVVGQDFYIAGQLDVNITDENPEGDFSQILEPGEQSSFELSFYPSAEGLVNGTLRILSNDIKTPNFELNLVGFAENEIGESVNEEISLGKEISFDSSAFLIQIDNNTVPENNTINLPVGILSIPDSNEEFSFQLTSEVENADNQFFVIESNELKANTIFNFEQKNTYVLSVRATNNTTNEETDANIIIHVLNVTEDLVIEDCFLDVKNLGYGLNDVEFIDNQQVVAVGSHGVILKSDDAGNSWRKIRSDWSNSLYHVQFTTNTVGYAIGNNILKTEDAGETWFTLHLPNLSYPIPTNMFFVDSEVGFVFGDDGKIFKTTNGGNYWTQKDLGSEDLDSAFFLNESLGFIVGSSDYLYKTLDGGDNWQYVDFGIEDLGFSAQFTNVYFVNNSIGFVSTNNGKIIKTINGGDSWELVSEIQYNQSITDIIFQDENIGYVLTEGDLYKSIDGGNTWVDEDIEHLYSGFQGIAVNENLNKACLVGHGTSCCSGSTTGHIIHTKELNNSWEKKSYISINSSPLSAVYSNENIKLVFGENTAVKSLDEGVTWLDIADPEDDVFQVEMLNNIVFLLGRHYIYKSEDFGETWITLGASTNFSKIAIINEQVFFATSYGSGIFKTTDGGLNWVNISTAPSFGVDVFFKNENEGYVGSINAGLYKTLDAGETWLPVQVDVMDGVSHVYSVSILNDIGFAGSSKGLLKTIDGGVSWQSTNINMEREIKRLHTINELEWYAVSDTRVFKSNDAGESWKTVFHTNDNIGDVHFEMDKVYVVGNNMFVEINEEDAPSVAGPIEGDLYVTSQSLEQYSVANDLNANYIWTVSGTNEISYSGNKAEILWNTPGTYQVSVTPYNACNTANTREISVVVEEDSDNPIIVGNENVEEYSINNEYSTVLNSDLRYDWFVNGHQNFSVSNNNIDVNWAESGVGNIQVITTSENTGTRKEAFLNVNIYPTSISSNNFDIEIIGETCPNKDNAQIIISAIEEYDYIATINGSEYNFTNDFTIENLAPNSYELCIAISQISYEQCYIVEIIEAESITGRTSVSSGMVSINIDKGTAPFKVYVNSELILETTSQSFSVDAVHGDVVEVKTAKDCEGILNKTIDLLNEVMVYPNPTNGDFYIKTPLRLEYVTVDLFTTQSQLISSKKYPVKNGKIHLSLKDEPNGLYLVRVVVDEPKMFKILKF